MAAGALESKVAMDNFVRAYHTAQLEGRVHPVYGLSCHFDCGSGRVNDANPIFPVLEIGQMSVALLNRLLGGRYLENLLRKDAGWNTALDEYAAYCQTWCGRESPTRPERVARFSTTITRSVTSRGISPMAPMPTAIYLFPSRARVTLSFVTATTTRRTFDRIVVSVNDVEKGYFH